ncbi:endonuclease V [bacterium]|nr:endonuclease V [bacterium]
MLLAVDIYYHSDNSATCIGVLFNWTDLEPKKVIKEHLDSVEPYVPGSFYLRELPCILEIVKNVDLKTLEAIIIDGHVYLKDDEPGLGAHLYNTLDHKVPIIGVAKRKYFAHSDLSRAILRGMSKTPLYITSIGLDIDEAKRKILDMPGTFRIPHMLKTLDQLTKQKK